MKKNDKVYLYWGEWCLVLYHLNLDDFRFIHCSDPIMADNRSCLISEDPILYNVKDAILGLMEPIRLHQAMADRLKGQSNDCPCLQSLLTFKRRDNRDICLKMEELLSDVMHHRDMWKDRFFFKVINDDSKVLCGACKEDMPQAFYVSGNEEAALMWRPVKAEECCQHNCKIYSWESSEDEEGYLQDIKVQECISDISNDDDSLSLVPLLLSFYENKSFFVPISFWANQKPFCCR